MRLGINLPYRRADGTSPDVHELMARARRIEELGFDGIWMGDTVGRWDFAGQDTLQWLLAAAAGTQRVEIGSAVMQMPLRNPVEFAQRLITLAALSGGRFVAGIGAGSTPRRTSRRVGLDVKDRFKLLREGLPVIRKLINGETVGVANHHPAPNVVGKPPIILAAWHSGPWIERAAREYDGWIASGFRGLCHPAGGHQALQETPAAPAAASSRPSTSTCTPRARASTKTDASRCSAGPRRPPTASAAWPSSASTTSAARASTTRPKTGLKPTCASCAACYRVTPGPPAKRTTTPEGVSCPANPAS